MKETEEIKINIDKKVLKKLEEIAELSMVSVSDIIVSEVLWFTKGKEDENNRLSSDTGTTMVDSLDADNIVSKMTIPTIEVNAEMDKEIDEYLSKQDGCRESGLDLDTFNERGFNTPDFEGKILQRVRDSYIGYVVDNGEVFSKLWTLNGVCSQGELWNLSPVKKEWYEHESNFPCVLVKDSRYVDESVIDMIICHTKRHWDSMYYKSWRLATRPERDSLFCEVDWR